MSNTTIENPFDSIESAYDFMNILAETILDAMKDLRSDHAVAVKGGQERTAKALELALYKTKTLNCYVAKSRRALNDLRTIRRLILNERMAPEAVVASSQYL